MFFRKFECPCDNPECRFNVYMHTKIDICSYFVRASMFIRYFMAMILHVKWIGPLSFVSSTDRAPYKNLICRTNNYSQEELSISRYVNNNNKSHSDNMCCDHKFISGPSHNRILFASLSTRFSGNVKVDVTSFFRHTIIDPRLTLRAGMLVRMIKCSGSYRMSLLLMAVRDPRLFWCILMLPLTQTQTMDDQFLLTLVMGDLYTAELDKTMTKVRAWPTNAHVH